MGAPLLSAPALIALVLLLAIGFIVLMALFIYCTFRVRTRARLKRQYPVFVIPSPRHSSSSDEVNIIPDFVEHGSNGVRLKKYARFSNNEFSVRYSKRRRKSLPNGVENPAFLQDESSSDELRIPQLPNDSLALELERNTKRRSKVFTESKNTLQYLAMRNSYMRRKSVSDENDGEEIANPDHKIPEEQEISGTEPSFFPLSPPPPVVKSQHKLRRDLAEAIACDQVAESSVQFSVPIGGADVENLAPSPIFWIDRSPIAGSINSLTEDNGPVLNNNKGDRVYAGNSLTVNGAGADQILAGNSNFDNFFPTPRTVGRTSPVEVICKQRTAV